MLLLTLCLPLFLLSRRCHAFFGGCSFVRPVDVDSVAEDALCHRLQLRATSHVASKGHASRSIIQHMISKVIVPPK